MGSGGGSTNMGREGMRMALMWMGSVVVSKRVRGRVMDVNVLRGETGGMSDHFLVEGRLRVAGRWSHRKVEGGREALKVSVLNERGKEREYKESIGRVCVCVCVCVCV